MRTIGLLGLLLLCGIARMSQCGEWSEPAVHPPVDNVVVDRRAVEDEPSPSADADERASPQRHATPEREIRSKKPSLIQVPTDDPPYVVGRVLLPEGAPASGAFVVVEDPAGPASVTLADETGAFRFTGFTAELVLRAERVSITATWQESFTDLTTGADPDLWRLDRRCWWTEAEVDPREEAVLTLQPTGGVRGRVVADLGAPWEVELPLECAPQDPRPGPVYDPKMPGPTGIRRVIFQGPDFQLGGLLHGGGWAVWAQLGSWSSSIESVDCGGGTEEVTLVLPRATVVRGSVLHHDGRPAPGRLVHAVPKTYWVNFYINPPPDPDGHSCSCPAHAETDDAGRFELEILGAGPVRLTCIDAEACDAHETGRQRAQAPGRVGHIGEGLLGPTIIHFGTPEQQARWLPPIVAGTELWCQGYSEPNAGSDLANVQARAELVDGEWHITGQKVWTSLAETSDYCFALCRTNTEVAKHKGISCLLVPMDQPGIEIVPIKQITGRAEFAEVFFDGARTAAENVVGPVDGGWRVAMGTLAFERGASTLGQQLSFVAELERVIEVARQTGAARKPLVRDRIAELWMRLEVMRLNALRTLSGHGGGELQREAYITKLYWATWHRDLGELAMDVLGTSSAIADPAYEDLHRLFLWARSDTIYAGTNQIQRNLIARRALGLPK